VQTPGKGYRVDDFAQLFTDAGLDITVGVYNDTRDILPQMQPPQVTTYCLYGYGTPTLIELQYENFVPGQYQTPKASNTSDLGDGTVPLLSLGECKSWSTEQSQPVNCREYQLISHGDVLKDGPLISDLLKIVTNQSPISGCTVAQTPVFDQHYGSRFPRGR